MAEVAALINWTLINFSGRSRMASTFYLLTKPNFFLSFCRHSSLLLPCSPPPPPPPRLCGFTPLLNLIKENAIQLSSSWPIACFPPDIILLFINTMRLPIRHKAHLVSRDGCGGTWDNDVSPRISFSQKCAWGYSATILDEPRSSFMFGVPDYKGFAQSSGDSSCQSVHWMLDSGQGSNVEAIKADTDWLRTCSTFT